MQKIPYVNDDIEIYTSLSRKHLEKGEFLRALSISFTARKLFPHNLQTLLDIAEIYSAMSLYDLSNKYLFEYLEKAPSSLMTSAYEELATNFFYLDNPWASGYYFHQKLKEDGFINSDGLDEEIAQFLEGTEDKKSQYFVAYPFERADYSSRVKSGKRALAFGDYNAASLIYSSIPNECRTEEISGDLAISYFLIGQDEKMKEVCKDSISRHGENVTALCNLSNYYRDKGDLEKSEYYYKRALSARKGSEDEPYKIATCAVELMDHIMSKECLEKIVNERPYDDIMNFFLGIAFLNLGEYENAIEVLKKSCRLNPEDDVYSFYAKYAFSLKDGIDDLGVLPLRYQKDYPDKITNRYKRIIREYAKGNILKKLKQNELERILWWGVNNKSDVINRQSLSIIKTLDKGSAFKLLKRILMTASIPDNVKRKALIYLITLGYREKVSILLKTFLVKFRIRKLLFMGHEYQMLYLLAYAFAITTAVFSGIEEFDKIGFSINKIFSVYHNYVIEESFTAEDIAALCICIAGIDKLKEDKIVCKHFNVDYQKIHNLICKIKGDKDDKNN